MRLLYSGKNQIQKSNLRMLVEELKLPIEYVEPLDGRLQADEVAIIDHHQREIDDVPLSLIKPSELAGYLAEGIGSGGGHYEKAGGFISMKLYEEKYPTFHADAGGGFGADCGKGCEGVYPVG